MCNQAALRAAIDDEEAVSMKHLEYAKDKFVMGPALKKKIPDPLTNKVTAYHEAGHTLVAWFTEDAMPVHKGERFVGHRMMLIDLFHSF